MEELWMRFVDNMAFRIEGPMKFRFVMQPVMAVIFAFIAGRRDALADQPPYFWSLVSDPAHRIDMLKDGWKSVGKVFVLAMVLDIVFQLMVLKTVYPGEVVVVAFLLAILPYLVVRGAVTRIMN